MKTLDIDVALLTIDDFEPFFFTLIVPLLKNFLLNTLRNDLNKRTNSISVKGWLGSLGSIYLVVL